MIMVPGRRKFPKRRTKIHTIFGLDAGVNMHDPSTSIEDREMTMAEEMVFMDGVMRKGKGTSYFGSTNSIPLSGSFLNGIRFKKSTGTEKAVVLTDEKAYWWNSTGSTYADITSGETLGGDEDDPFCYAIVNDYLIFSNGVSPVYYWDGTAGYILQLPGATSLGCRAMALIGERLCLYGIASHLQRAQWTIVGGITPAEGDWEDAGSGDTDLVSVLGQDVVMAAANLGQYVMIYGEHTIALQEYDGASTSDPYNFYTQLSGIGTPSRRGVVDLGDGRHIVLGWDDVYEYRGGRSIYSIAGKIRSDLFSMINPTYISRSFIQYLSDREEVRIHFPLVGSTLPTRYVSYNLRSKAWSFGTRSYTGGGLYKRSDSETWDGDSSDTTTWDGDNKRWDDSTVEESAEVSIYGNSTGAVFLDDRDSNNLAGSAMDAYADTKDFVPSEEYRDEVVNWSEIHFEAFGSTVTVYYSSDLGYTWNEVETTTLTGFWTKYVLNINVNSEQIRLRFRNSASGGNFEFRSIGLGFIPASNRGKA